MRSADPKLFAELAERPAGFSQLHEPFSVEDFSRSPEDFTLRSRCFQTGKRALGNPGVLASGIDQQSRYDDRAGPVEGILDLAPDVKCPHLRPYLPHSLQ